MASQNFLCFDEYLADALRQAVDNTLRDVFQINTETDSCKVGHNIPLVMESLETCIITIQQENVLCGAFIAAFSRDMLLKILKQYADNESQDRQLLEDAASEITNMIYGAFKTDMNKRGYKLAMSIPFPVGNSQDTIGPYVNAEKMILPFLADGHKCKIIIAQKHAPQG